MPKMPLGVMFAEIRGKTAHAVFTRKNRNQGGAQDVYPRFKRKRHRTGNKGFRGLSRAAFRYADDSFTAMSPAARQVWKDAVKKPNTTAYTLWMAEALTSLMALGRCPKAPSESGGWSTSRVIPAEDFPRLDYFCTELPYAGTVG